MDKEYLDMLEKAIVVTKKNHPDRDMATQIKYGVNAYFKELLKNDASYLEAQKQFYNCFSRRDNITKETIRDYFHNKSINNQDVVLKLFDNLYYYAYTYVKEDKFSKRSSEAINYCYTYRNLLDELYKKDLESLKFQIYKNPFEIYKNPFKIDLLISLLGPIIDMYVDDVLLKKGLSVTVTSFTELGKNIFSNIDILEDLKLKDNYFAEHKSGDLNIQLASVKGYKEDYKSQQDAVLSISRDGCSLNIVADGVGGSYKGEKASISIINQFADWFNKKDLTKYKSNYYDPTAILNEIVDEIKEINNNIKTMNKSDEKINQNSASTLSLAFFTPYYVIFVGVGDSPAYVVKRGDNLESIEPVNELDTLTNKMSYEAARHNPYNNVVTNSIGNNFDERYIHANIIPKSEAKRVILASDGVTDLISYKNFLQMLRDDAKAIDFVKKASKDGDVLDTSKKMDNITMASIEIDEKEKKRGYR